MAHPRRPALVLAVTVLTCLAGSPTAQGAAQLEVSQSASSVATSLNALDTALPASRFSTDDTGAATGTAPAARAPIRHHRHRSAPASNPRIVRYDPFDESRSDRAGAPALAERGAERTESAAGAPHGFALLCAGLLVMVAAARRRQPYEPAPALVPPVLPPRSSASAGDSVTLTATSLGNREVTA